MKRALLILTILCLIAGLLPIGHTLAQAQTGVIQGQVVNATPGGPPIGIIPLTLRKFRRMTEEGETLGQTDAQGRFRFQDLELHQDIRYFVQAGYQDVAYRSQAIDLVRQPGPVEVPVYETTTSDAGLYIRRVSIAVPEVQGDRGFVAFLELITVVNETGKAYVGNLFTDKEQGGVVRIPLPPDAVNVSLAHGFGPEGVRPVLGGMVGLTPLPPGDQELIFSYGLPYTETALTLRRLYAYPLRSVTVLVKPDGPTAGGPGLESQGQVDVPDVGPNILLTGGAVPAGDVLTLELRGLPRFASLRDEGVSLDTALRGAAIALMALAVAAALFYTMVLRKRLGAAGVPITDAVALERERQELVTALAQLEEQREAGQMPAETCERLRSRHRRRLTDVLLLLREQTGEAAT